MSALSAMQDKTQHLENSLSAETRIKLDLFSALGDAKRQLEIAQGTWGLPFHTDWGKILEFCGPHSALRGDLVFPALGICSLNHLSSPSQPIKLIQIGV